MAIPGQGVPKRAFDCRSNDSLFDAPPPAPARVESKPELVPDENLLMRLRELFTFLENLQQSWAQSKVGDSFKTAKVAEIVQHKATVEAAGLYIKARLRPQTQGGSK